MAHAGIFSADTVVVERLGDGTSSLNSTSAPIAILEVGKSGDLVQTILLPTNGTSQQTDAGNAASAGYLNTFFSGGTGYLSVPGYDAAAGTASVASKNTKVNSTFDATGTVISRTEFPTNGLIATPLSPFSGNNFRSSIATGSNTFYAAGTSSGTPNTGGMWYYDGASFTQLNATVNVTNGGIVTNFVSNMRQVEIYNNQLYFSSSTGTNLGVSSLGLGLPTSGPLWPTLQINAGAGASTYGFVMFSTGLQGTNVLDLAYLADDRTALGGGLQKWAFDGTAWSNSWSLLVGGANTTALSSVTNSGFAGLRGLGGIWDATNGATLYATTTEASNNRLISILDAGTTPTNYTLLQSAGAGYVFRGVDLSPVQAIPEPSTVALALIGGSVAILAARRRRRD